MDYLRLFAVFALFGGIACLLFGWKIVAILLVSYILCLPLAALGQYMQHHAKRRY